MYSFSASSNLCLFTQWLKVGCSHRWDENAACFIVYLAELNSRFACSILSLRMLTSRVTRKSSLSSSSLTTWSFLTSAWLCKYLQKRSQKHTVVYSNFLFISLSFVSLSLKLSSNKQSIPPSLSAMTELSVDIICLHGQCPTFPGRLFPKVLSSFCSLPRFPSAYVANPPSLKLDWTKHAEVSMQAC